VGSIRHTELVIKKKECNKKSTETGLGRAKATVFAQLDKRSENHYWGKTNDTSRAAPLSREEKDKGRIVAVGDLSALDTQSLFGRREATRGGGRGRARRGPGLFLGKR